MRVFAYQRSLAPLIWVLAGLSLLEAALIHLLVALLWSRWAALAMSLVTLAAIGWLVLLIRSFASLPVLIGEQEVVMRVGRLKQVRFARDAVADIEEEASAAELRDRTLLKLSLLAHPNVIVRLRAPVQVGRRHVTSVAHRLDDPASFALALRA